MSTNQYGTTKLHNPIRGIHLAYQVSLDMKVSRMKSNAYKPVYVQLGISTKDAEYNGNPLIRELSAVKQVLSVYDRPQLFGVDINKDALNSWDDGSMNLFLGDWVDIDILCTIRKMIKEKFDAVNSTPFVICYIDSWGGLESHDIMLAVQKYLYPNTMYSFFYGRAAQSASKVVNFVDNEMNNYTTKNIHGMGIKGIIGYSGAGMVCLKRIKFKHYNNSRIFSSVQQYNQHKEINYANTKTIV